MKLVHAKMVHCDFLILLKTQDYYCFSVTIVLYTYKEQNI